MATSVSHPVWSSKLPIRVALVGTGFAAKLRAQTLQSEERAHLVAVAGHTPEQTEEFSQTYSCLAISSWEELVCREDVDMVIICTVNQNHGAIALTALNAAKHVVVEYPLALEVDVAEEAIASSKEKNQLLHVEHIELLGGLHQALRQTLPQIGEVFYARYSTINPQRPAPQRWTYHPELFGFPFSGALSRIHRLTDLFGTVATVSCQARFWGELETREEGLEIRKSFQFSSQEPPFYKSCLCTAQLKFTSGVVAEVVYGKGENLWQPSRSFEVHGEQGGLMFDGDEGKLIKDDETTPIEVGGRRGLFAKDTGMVLDYLIEGTPLYVTPEASLYALKVADAARRSAETGQTVLV
ncbi:Gfo/Idh/MocA family protein [Funiculus sociatus]|uniref:Gfo/Idh/MocA family protein n=1 Tax=Funiculus sociatus TaxID=450527 RepID=UPI003297B296